jgi:hypothetical protein
VAKTRIKTKKVPKTARKRASLFKFLFNQQP